MLESPTSEFVLARSRGNLRGHTQLVSTGAACLTVLASLVSSPVCAATFLVTNLNNGGAGSLRSAISGAVSSIGGDIVAFDPALSGVITLSTALPVINGTNADATEIRGETANDAGSGPDITIDGGGLGFEGIVLGANVDNCIVRGLRVVGCSNGFVVRGSLATTPTGNALGGPGGRHLNVATGNANGVLVEGDQQTTLIANMHCINNSVNGAVVRNDATSVIFGGPGANEFNVFSGNSQHGVLITGTSTTDVDHITLAYSLIGLDRNGVTPLPNLGDGVRMVHSGSGTIHTVALKENTISGNTGNGVTLSTAVHDVDLDGNRIGTDLTGTAPRPNDQHGVQMLAGATNNELRHPLISGVGPNIVSGNGGTGVEIWDDSNIVDGCHIGVEVSGSLAMGNGLDGVLLRGGADLNQVLNSVISANGRNGVHCAEGTSYSTVSFCSIGTNLPAVNPLPNGGAARTGGALIGGIAGGDPLSGGPSHHNTVFSNTIGGHGAADQFGVGIFAGSYNNTVDTNWIGTNNGGLSFLPNRFGIMVSVDSHLNILDGNLISWSLSHGIRLEGHDNTLYRNKIGTDLAGLVDHPNADSGIYVSGYQNTIGGLRSTGQGNQISGNWKWGIEAHNYNGSSFYSLSIRGNDIGLASDGSALGNGLGGIWIGQGFRNCQIGDLITTPTLGDEANSVAYNGGAAGVGDPGAGVVVGETGAGTDEPHTVTIFTNAIYENAGEGIEIDYYSPPGNMNIARPIISSATPTLIEGSINIPASPVSIVQLFTDTADEGQTYIGQVAVIGTTWSFVPTPSLALGARVTATHTAEIAATNHTSEFSEPSVVSIPFTAPTIVMSVLPDLGGGAVAKTGGTVMLPLSSASTTLVGGEMVDPNDGARFACFWEGSESLDNWPDFELLGVGTINCSSNDITFDSRSFYFGGQTGEESTGQAALWGWDPNLPTQLTVLPTSGPGAPGEVRAFASNPSTAMAGGWSTDGAVGRAAVWSSLKEQGWLVSFLPDGNPALQSRVNGLQWVDTYDFYAAAGFVTVPGGAKVPYVWREADGWSGAALPLPAGSAAGEVNAIVDDAASLQLAGWHRTTAGLQRAAIWSSADGGQSWSVLDAGSLPGDPESVLYSLHGHPIPPEKPVGGASISADGSERAMVILSDGNAFTVFDLNDLVVNSEGLLLERVLGAIETGVAEVTFVGRARSGNPLGRGGYPSAFVVTEIAPVDVPEAPSETGLPPNLALGVEPNPSSASTSIRFELRTASTVRLTVHDATGREVAAVTAGERAAGAHVVSWDGRGRAGRALPQGVYFLRLQAGTAATTSRVVRR